jgi:ferredoxin
MPTVKFIKENKEIEVPEGANLRSEAIKAGINMHQGFNGMGASVNKFLNCKGWAQCGTCRVLITKGMENTSPMGFVEKTRFHCPVPTPVTIGGIDPLPCLAYVGHEDTCTYVGHEDTWPISVMKVPAPISVMKIQCDFRARPRYLEISKSRPVRKSTSSARISLAEAMTPGAIRLSGGSRLTSSS